MTRHRLTLTQFHHAYSIKGELPELFSEVTFGGFLSALDLGGVSESSIERALNMGYPVLNVPQ